MEQKTENRKCILTIEVLRHQNENTESRILQRYKSSNYKAPRDEARNKKQY
jgi:hypothetical protein